MRKLRTTANLLASSWSVERLRREVRDGVITRIIQGVYGEGGEPPSELDRLRATAIVTGGVADAVASGYLHGFDGVERWWPRVLVAAGTSGKRAGVKRVSALPVDTVVAGSVRCLPAAIALRELASVLDDTHWEQALEFCLRKKLVSPDEVGAWGHRRVRRVIGLRGGLLVPATESLLETLAVQLCGPTRASRRPSGNWRSTTSTATSLAGPTCAGRISEFSSNSTVSNTRTSRCTTPAARPGSRWRRAGAVPVSPGTR